MFNVHYFDDNSWTMELKYLAVLLTNHISVHMRIVNLLDKLQ